MGHPARTAKDPAVHSHRACALVLRQDALFQRGRCQNRFEHRTDGVAFQRAVQKRAVRGIKACRRILRVIPRHADAGADGCRLRIQYQNASAGHRIRRHCFRRTLDRAADRQLHPGSAAVVPDEFYALSGTQPSLCRNSTFQHIVCSGARQHGIQRLFQTCGAAAIAVNGSDQMLTQRHRGIALHRAVPKVLPAGRLREFQQERRGTVPVPVQKCLPRCIGIGVQPGIVVFSGKAQDHPTRFQPGEQQTVVIIKIAPPGWQIKRDRALRFGA